MKSLRMRCVASIGLLLACVASVQAQTPPAAMDERAALRAQRQRLEDEFDAEQARCAQRFAVTACVDDVRQRRRAALEPLREREWALDEAQRRERAAQRAAAVQAKQREAAERPAAASEPVPPVRAPLGGASGAAAPARGVRREQDASAAQAAERASAAERRREQARATQERIQRREAERAARGKTAQPLPLPASGNGR